MELPSNNKNISNELAISHLAYKLWRDAGRPAGRYIDFWIKAERQVAAEKEAAAREGLTPPPPPAEPPRAANQPDPN